MRKRGGRAVASVAVFLALACAVVGCAEQGTSSDLQSAALPFAEGVNRNPPVSSIPDGEELPGWSHSPDFAADGSGMTLLAECPAAGRPSSGCKQHVATLDKGARTWRRVTSPLPSTLVDSGVSAGLTVLGPGRALITAGRGQLPDRTWFTRDSGSTWRPGTDRLQPGSIAVVPAGAPLVSSCARLDKEGNNCVRSQLAVIMPGTGRYHRLAELPALDGQLTPAGETDDGTLYVSGTRPGTDLLTLALSKDRGRTWKTITMSGVAPGGFGGLSVVAGKDGCYAVQPGQLPADTDVKNGLLTIHHSPDCGTTWERVWTYRPGVEPRSVLGVPIAADDRSLTIHTENGGVWRSTDNGRTFRSASGTGAGEFGWVRRTPLGYLWGSASGDGSYYLSADGVHRQTFRLGNGS